MRLITRPGQGTGGTSQAAFKQDPPRVSGSYASQLRIQRAAQDSPHDPPRFQDLIACHPSPSILLIIKDDEAAFVTVLFHLGTVDELSEGNLSC